MKTLPGVTELVCMLYETPAPHTKGIHALHQISQQLWRPCSGALVYATLIYNNIGNNKSNSIALQAMGTNLYMSASIHC